MAQAQLFTGDDWSLSVTLERDGVAFNASTATDISAAVVSGADQHACVLIAARSMDSGAAGADWSTGVVILDFPASVTSGVSEYGARYIEIQVTIGGKKTTWPRLAVLINKGLIE